MNEISEDDRQLLLRIFDQDIAGTHENREQVRATLGDYNAQGYDFLDDVQALGNRIAGSLEPGGPALDLDHQDFRVLEQVIRYSDSPEAGNVAALVIELEHGSPGLTPDQASVTGEARTQQDPSVAEAHVKYEIGAGEHERLIEVLNEEIALTKTSLNRIEDQAAWSDDDVDTSDLGDDYDAKHEHLADLEELRDTIEAHANGTGSATLDLDDWQRSAIDQARDIAREQDPDGTAPRAAAGSTPEPQGANPPAVRTATSAAPAVGVPQPVHERFDRGSVMRGGERYGAARSDAPQAGARPRGIER